MKQCRAHRIPFLDALPKPLKGTYSLFESKATRHFIILLCRTNLISKMILLEFDLIVDAIFGYSFNGAIREPFATIIRVFIRQRLSEQYFKQ